MKNIREWFAKGRRWPKKRVQLKSLTGRHVEAVQFFILSLSLLFIFSFIF
jgi:hypothetical protein